MKTSKELKHLIRKSEIIINPGVDDPYPAGCPE